MTIEFKKVVELNGETWYKIYVDSWCVNAKCENTNPNAMEETRNVYTNMVRAAKEGLPYTETLDSQTIISPTNKTP